MTDFSLQVQGYGHLGIPNYEKYDQEWSFTRLLSAPVVFSLLYPPVRLLDGTEPQSTVPYINTVKLSKNIATVASTYPEVYELAHWAGSDLIVSWALTNSHREYDPSIGNLIAFGFITVRGWSTTTVPTYATVGGSSSSILRVAILEMDTIDIDKQQEDFGHSAPVATQSIAYWEDENATIRQVVFSKQTHSLEQIGIQKGDLLAVRLASKTVILRPLVEKYRAYDEDLGALTSDPWKKLSLNKIVEVPVRGDANSEHADVCFNPWFSQELATIDRRGRWAIYNFKADSTLPIAKFNPRPFFQGTIQLQNIKGQPEEIRTAPDHCRQDGWARISWTKNASILAVCTRTRLQFLHTKARSITSFVTAIPGEIVWNLAMCTAGDDAQYILLLTSTRVLWIEVVVHESNMRDAFRVEPKLLHSIRHFRDPLDLGLQLRTIPIEDGIL
jgi:RNA polymerase I-specific transcription initiation factor RRN6